MRSTALFSALFLALVACAGKTPDTVRYLLPAATPVGTARVEPPRWIALGGIQLAPYLMQAGLVVETGAREVRPARFHRWAEPLDAGLRRFLRAEISAALGYDIAADTAQRSRWDETVELEIDRLHGTLSGEAVLVARWQVRPAPGQGEPRAFRFTERRPLAEAGYAGLVEAEIALLKQLAQEIAGSLR